MRGFRTPYTVRSCGHADLKDFVKSEIGRLEDRVARLEHFPMPFATLANGVPLEKLAAK